MSFPELATLLWMPSPPNPLCPIMGRGRAQVGECALCGINRALASHQWAWPMLPCLHSRDEAPLRGLHSRAVPRLRCPKEWSLHLLFSLLGNPAKGVPAEGHAPYGQQHLCMLQTQKKAEKGGVGGQGTQKGPGCVHKHPICHWALLRTLHSGCPMGLPCLLPVGVHPVVPCSPSTLPPWHFPSLISLWPAAPLSPSPPPSHHLGQGAA